MKKDFILQGILMIIVGSLIIMYKRISIGLGMGMEIKNGMEYLVAIPGILFGIYLLYRGDFILKFKDIISDFKIIHLILFIFIAFPFLFGLYLMLFKN